MSRLPTNRNTEVEDLREEVDRLRVSHQNMLAALTAITRYDMDADSMRRAAAAALALDRTEP